MSRPVSLLACVLSLAAFAGAARAETVHLRDGQRVVGRVVAEDADEVVVHTSYGVLTIPRREVERIEGEAVEVAPPQRDDAAPAELPAPPPDPAAKMAAARVRVLVLKGRRLVQLKKYAKALKRYDELLELDPEHIDAHFQTARAHAALGDTKAALASLEAGIRVGGTDLAALRRDPLLEPLHAEARFAELVAGVAELLAHAAERAPERVIRRLRSQGARATYARSSLPGDPPGLVLIAPTGAPAEQAAELVERVGHLRRALFAGPPSRPLLVVLLAEADGHVLPKHGAARFDPQQNVIVSRAPAFGELGRAVGLWRTLVRALEHDDESARDVEHPAWLRSGLSALLGTAQVADGGLAFTPGAGLKALRERAFNEGTQARTSWSRMLAMSQRELDEAGPTAHAQARSVLRYLAERGKLRALYEEVVRRLAAPEPEDGEQTTEDGEQTTEDGERTAEDGERTTEDGEEAAEPDLFEAVLGQPLLEAEETWLAWLAKQEPPRVPFLGVLVRRVRQGLRVTYIQPETGAAEADLDVRDVIVSLDGIPVRTEEELNALLLARRPGDPVALIVQRGEARLRKQVTLGPPPRGPIRPPRTVAPYVGVAVEPAGKHLVLHEVDADSPAAQAGLRVGDRVQSADGVALSSVRSWLRALRQKQPGDTWQLQVIREGAQLQVEVELIDLAAR